MKLFTFRHTYFPQLQCKARMAGLYVDACNLDTEVLNLIELPPPLGNILISFPILILLNAFYFPCKQLFVKYVPFSHLNTFRIIVLLGNA